MKKWINYPANDSIWRYFSQKDLGVDRKDEAYKLGLVWNIFPAHA